MMCIRCGGEGAVQLYFKQSVCRSCFVELAEKKLRKNLREEQIFRKDDNIIVLDDRSCKARVSVAMLRNVLNGLPVKINVVEDLAGVEDGARIVVPWSLEDENRDFLEGFMFNKRKDERKNIVRLLKPLAEEEIRIIAEIKNIDCEDKHNKNGGNHLESELNKLYEKYPGIKHALMKTSRTFKKIGQS